MWVPRGLAQLANRNAVDKTLQRLVAAGQLRQIDRGLYDGPVPNKLTRRPSPPDYRAVVEAIARRDQLRLLVGGMTVANDLELTDAVPTRVTIHTDARCKFVALDNLTIEFKQTALSKLYWAGWPAMRVVQTLHWLKDAVGADSDHVVRKLRWILSDPIHGEAIRKDLLGGFRALPIWIQAAMRALPVCETNDLSSRSNAQRTRRAGTTRRAARHTEFTMNETFNSAITATGWSSNRGHPGRRKIKEAGCNTMKAKIPELKAGWSPESSYLGRDALKTETLQSNEHKNEGGVT